MKHMLAARPNGKEESGKCRPLPLITIRTTANYYKALTSPGCDLKAVIGNAAGDPVGTATYALSPLGDRVYVFGIEVHAVCRRQGYALALLRYLAHTYGVPMTPIHELRSASGFWSAARHMDGMGLILTASLSSSEMDNESIRWQHLRADSDRLQKQITERLIHGEPWDIAVGRGLDEATVAV
jgi:hypothetical protein